MIWAPYARHTTRLEVLDLACAENDWKPDGAPSAHSPRPGGYLRGDCA